MLPRKVTLRGITTAHVGEVVIDLEEAGDGLIALTGGNGCGKTTALEVIGGPLVFFGKSPSKRCVLSTLAISADSLVRWEGTHGGEEWIATRTINATKAFHGQDAQLVIDGVDLETGGRVPDYDAEIAARFMSPKLYLASLYGAQHGAGSFIGMKESERRDLFAELLGISELQDKAEASREIANAAEGALEELDRRIARAGGSAGELEQARGELAPAQEEAEELQGYARAAGQKALESAAEARTAHGALTTAESAHNAAKLRESMACDKVSATEKQKAEAEQLVEDLGPVLDAAEDTRARRQRVLNAATANRDEDAAHQTAQTVQTVAATLASSRADHRSAAVRDLERLQALEEHAGELEDLREDLAELVTAGEAAKASLVKCEGEHRTASDDLSLLNTSLFTARRGLGLAQRAADLVARVPCGGGVVHLTAGPSQAADCSECELLTGAISDRDRLTELEAEVPALEAQVEAAVARCGELLEATAIARSTREEHLGSWREKDARRKALEEGQPDDLAAALEAAVGSVDTSRAQAEQAREKADVAFEELNASRQRLEACPAPSATELTVTAEALVELEDAERKIGAIRERLEAAIRDLPEIRRSHVERVDEFEAAVVALATADPENAAALELESLAAKKRSEECEGRHQTALGVVAACEARIATLEEGLAKAAEVTEARAGLAAKAGRHRLLEHALGRKGIQAHEIDGAGPMVGELVNELLSACYGERWRVELVTLQEASARRKQREVFRISIHDADRGDVRDFDSLSGGEQVIVDEGLKLALAILTARRSGIRCETLYRDEVDGKLDSANADAYPRMLRRAMQMGGFRRCYFVSHRSEVWGQADARIDFTPGAVTIERAA